MSKGKMTFQPGNTSRSRTHGFLVRMSTRSLRTACPVMTNDESSMTEETLSVMETPMLSSVHEPMMSNKAVASIIHKECLILFL